MQPSQAEIRRAALSKLTLTERLAIARQPEGLNALKFRRRQARDQAIRNAVALLCETLSFTGAAKKLSRDCVRYSETDWPRDRAAGGPPVDDRTRILLHEILQQNDGLVLGWKRICQICTGENEFVLTNP